VAIEILCTLGPASMNERVIRRLTDLGVSLFRINLSHTDLADLPGAIELIRLYTQVPICLDSEGAQVRNGPLVGGAVTLVEHAQIQARRLGEPGNAKVFSFYPESVVDLLEVGDFISIDFNAVLVQVVDKEQGAVTMRILNGGVIGQNKAVSVHRTLTLPVLTDKDLRAIEIGRRMGILDYALSFANSGADVDLIRELCGEPARIISKIECRNGLTHLAEIAERSDAILIDRGDLSREVPIERIPMLQKEIIQHCNRTGRKVYVATNLLESMIHQPGPTRAEVNDVITTLATGADGLVLAAETAVGINPIASANMIVRLIHSFDTSRQREENGFYYEGSGSLLAHPHGGVLVDRRADELTRQSLTGLRSITARFETLMDCEQIAVGTYSPLSGFMDRETLMSVLSHSLLPSGVTWTMPILLPLDEGAIFVPDVGERVLIRDHEGAEKATIDVREIFNFDIGRLAQGWYGTADPTHPGVARLRELSGRFVAGDIHLLAHAKSPYRHYELTPEQTRFVFVQKGWTRVIGFHTRNPAHRVHEYLQLTALRDTLADGLYLSPVIGPKKEGDFLPGPIMESYQALMRLGVYPEGRVVLGSFSTYSRFAGPREAIFTAICRKNMGCSHFIIGRDHAGVGNFYAADALDRYLDNIGDLGIELIRFGPVVWDAKHMDYAPQEEASEPVSISGSQVRDALRSGKRLPEWFMRPEIQDIMLAKIAGGQDVFC
jgi:pyruvate kinase